MSEDDSVERLSVVEAAERLGVTRDAIHKRIRRGSIEHEQGADGRFYVYVDTSTSGLDLSVDESKDESKVEVMERLIARLELELEQANERDRENRRIIAALTQRIPAIEAAPTEMPPEAPGAATEQPGRVEPQASVEGEESASERPEERSWWRRMFRG
jgi:hypothetical protein